MRYGRDHRHNLQTRKFGLVFSEWLKQVAAAIGVAKGKLTGMLKSGGLNGCFLVLPIRLDRIGEKFPESPGKFAEG